MEFFARGRPLSTDRVNSISVEHQSSALHWHCCHQLPPVATAVVRCVSVRAYACMTRYPWRAPRPDSPGTRIRGPRCTRATRLETRALELETVQPATHRPYGYRPNARQLAPCSPTMHTSRAGKGRRAGIRRRTYWYDVAPTWDYYSKRLSLRTTGMLQLNPTCCIGLKKQKERRGRLNVDHVTSSRATHFTFLYRTLKRLRTV